MAYRFQDLSVGQSASFAKTVTEADIVLFAGVSGDTNPVHLDEIYARETMFKGRIAHGMLSAGFISTVFGTKLPVEQFAVVAVGVGLALADFRIIASPVGMSAVDVAHGQDVAESGMLLGVAGSHAAHADAADAGAVVRRLVREGRGRPGHVGHEPARRRSGSASRRAQETSACRPLRACHASVLRVVVNPGSNPGKAPRPHAADDRG